MASYWDSAFGKSTKRWNLRDSESRRGSIFIPLKHGLGGPRAWVRLQVLKNDALWQCQADMIWHDLTWQLMAAHVLATLRTVACCGLPRLGLQKALPVKNKPNCIATGTLEDFWHGMTHGVPVALDMSKKGGSKQKTRHSKGNQLEPGTKGYQQGMPSNCLTCPSRTRPVLWGPPSFCRRLKRASANLRV